MISEQALQFWTGMRAGPKQIDMPLAERRRAGEHAEDMTVEPPGIAYRQAPEVAGLWAVPPDGEADAALLYLFGGGYVLGSPASRRKTAGHLALATRARVLVPNYRLAPEHPFPAAVDDALTAWQWLLHQDVSAAKTIIVGDSAGGGLALATAIAARDRAAPLPAGIATLSAWTDLTCSGETMRLKAARDIECSREGLLEMARWYMGPGDPKQPTASPLFANLSGLPPLLSLVGGDEVLLDDSVRLVRKAGMEGVDATLYVGAGMQHVFPIWGRRLSRSGCRNRVGRGMVPGPLRGPSLLSGVAASPAIGAAVAPRSRPRRSHRHRALYGNRQGSTTVGHQWVTAPQMTIAAPRDSRSLDNGTRLAPPFAVVRVGQAVRTVIPRSGRRSVDDRRCPRLG